MTLKEVYNSAIKPLPTSDRLQLAAMILSDIPPQAVTDFQDAWSEQDLQKFTAAVWKQSPDDLNGDNDQGR